MGSLFGGGGGQKTSSRSTSETSGTTENRIDPEFEQYARDLLQLTTAVSNRPYEAYQGERVADFTDDQERAFSAVRANQGVWRPDVGSATDIANSLKDREYKSFLDADIQGYQNPYTQSVIDRSLSEINRQADIERNQIRGAMHADSAFGGARHGVIESEQRRNTADLKQNLIASLLQRSYEDAANRFYTDEQSRFQNDQFRIGVGDFLQGLGHLKSNLGYADSAALLDIGSRQQAQEQARLDAAYEDYLRQFNYPAQQLAYRQSIFSGLPFNTSTASSGTTNTTGTQTLPSGSGFGQGIGAITSLAGAVGKIAPLFSSSKLKEDFGEADRITDAEEREAPKTILERVVEMPVKTWRYKPEMGLGSELRVGPMAEDFADAFGGDGITIDPVNYHGVTFAAIKQLAHKVQGMERAA